MLKTLKLRLPYTALVALLILGLAGCEDDISVPKPVGYFRIDLPEHSYSHKDFGCPFSFDISKESQLVFYEDTKDRCWFNIHYPALDATLHITYKPVQDNLRDYIEESRALAFEHQSVANNINQTLVNKPTARVFGLTYDLGGRVASPFQFYLTDSLNYFLRGSLYFNTRPNPDSLQPSLEYIRADMQHFTETFEWIKPN